MDAKKLDYEDHALWPESIESYFIGLLHDEAKKGLQTTTLEKKGWQMIENGIFNTFGKRYKVDKLKSKFNRLRKSHREFSHLLEQTGMGWDPQTNTVTASDEVWEIYLKKYPNAKRYRKKGLAHYEVLGEIFNNTTATGGMGSASTQLPFSANDECQQERRFVGTRAHVDVGNEFVGENDEEGEEVIGVRRRTSAPPDAPRPKEKKNKEANSAFDHVMEELAKSISSKIEASIVRTENMCKFMESREKRNTNGTNNVSDPLNVAECQDILEAIPNLDDKKYCKALEKFIATPEWRQVFMRMSEQRRCSWLDSLIE